MNLDVRHLIAAALVALLVGSPIEGLSAIRVKDLTMVRGARDNQLVGYGLVVGLVGDGDKNPVYTVQSVANMLKRFGVNVPAATLQAKNVAAVMVTADIPAFAKPGSRLDVTVSSLGDAKTLQGGVLMQTPLFGADEVVYAVAQGSLVIGGFSAGPGGAGGASVQKNHPTVGQIMNGALVEREVKTRIVENNRLELITRYPDFTTVSRLAKAINERFPNSCTAVDASTVRVRLPQELEAFPVDFLSRLEHIEVSPDTTARIIINEKTGTIVANSQVYIAPCAVSHGNLTINIASTLDVSQPNAFAENGETVVTPRTETTVTENKATLIPLPELPTVERVASSLNSLGVTPRDIMSIFQAMKQAGALQAELIVR